MTNKTINYANREERVLLWAKRMPRLEKAAKEVKRSHIYLPDMVKAELENYGADKETLLR